MTVDGRADGGVGVEGEADAGHEVGERVGRRGRGDAEAQADLGVGAGADGGAAEQGGAVAVGQGEVEAAPVVVDSDEQPVAAVGDLDRGRA